VLLANKKYMTEEINQVTPEPTQAEMHQEESNTAPAPAPVPTPVQETKTSTGDKNTGMAVVAYIIFFIPMLTGDYKKDAFVNYHVKQGLALFCVAIVLNILGMIMPLVWLMIGWLFSLGILALAIIGSINAVNGKKEPLPAVGFIADYFKF